MHTSTCKRLIFRPFSAIRQGISKGRRHSRQTWEKSELYQSSYDDPVSKVASALASAPESGVQMGSGLPCHQSLGRPPLPNDNVWCSQRISSSPLSTPPADMSAEFPTIAPSALCPLGGRCTRRNGRGDALAARRHPRVKADSETRSATAGGSAGVGT